MKLKLLVFWSQSPGDTEEGQETSKWKSEPSDDGRGKNWLTWWGPSKRTSSSKRCDALVQEKRWHFPQTIKRGHSVSRCNREYPTEDKLRSPLYELVVRNPMKGSSPVPVATYVTCDHTTASVLYFLSAFQTDHAKLYRNIRPVMIVCDGSMVLMQAISQVFCQTNLNALLLQYFNILTGKGTTEDLSRPILHRCLSHVMRNAKTLIKNK